MHEIQLSYFLLVLCVRGVLWNFDEALVVQRFNVLPRFIIVANPHQYVVVRLAGAKVLIQPYLGFSSVTRTVNLERIPVSINDGNPFLDPCRANQLDLY